MIRKSITELTLDTELLLSARLLGSPEPGDSSEEIAVRDLADLTAQGAAVTRVWERDAEGAVVFQYRMRVDSLLRYEAAWGDPAEPVAEAAWRQGFRGGSEMDLSALRDRLRRLWRERYGQPLEGEAWEAAAWAGAAGELCPN